jgi:hypothetical protein
MDMWQMMLFYIHEHHPNNDAVEHADSRHIALSISPAANTHPARR